jgi:hypothetical protein
MWWHWNVEALLLEVLNDFGFRQPYLSCGIVRYVLCAKCFKRRRRWEAVCPCVLFPKLLKGFWLNLVLKLLYRMVNESNYGKYRRFMKSILNEARNEICRCYHGWFYEDASDLVCDTLQWWTNTSQHGVTSQKTRITRKLIYCRGSCPAAVASADSLETR